MNSKITGKFELHRYIVFFLSADSSSSKASGTVYSLKDLVVTFPVGGGGGGSRKQYSAFET